MTEDFERNKVPIKTVLAWLGSAILGVIAVMMVWMQINDRMGRLESDVRQTENRIERADQMEQRIRNLEENVLWRHQDP